MSEWWGDKHIHGRFLVDETHDIVEYNDPDVWRLEGQAPEFAPVVACKCGWEKPRATWCDIEAHVGRTLR